MRASKSPRFTALYEKICFITFTAGLVLYIQDLDPHAGRWPISWLLLTWCINSAQILSELFYSSRHTAWFASLWSAISISLKVTSDHTGLSRVFTSDLEWLNFHRLCFLLAYAFIILMIPLAIKTVLRRIRHQDETSVDAWTEDRMQYRMILWALPLLTIGFLIEALFLLERGEVPGPVQIWTTQKETFLALGTWMFCGVFLHLRLLYGWRGARLSGPFLLGAMLVVAGHLSQNFLHFRPLP